MDRKRASFSDYGGPFTTRGMTFSLGAIGITASIFYGGESIFEPGTAKGFTLGYAPGAGFSLWGSWIYYT